MKKREYSFPRIFVFFSSFSMLNLACHNNQQDGIEQEIRNLKMETLPAQGILTDTTQIEKNTSGVTRILEVQSSWDWKQYAEWVTNNVTGRNELIATENNCLNFRRSLTGDIFDLQILNSSVDPLHVRVTFVARSN